MYLQQSFYKYEDVQQVKRVESSFYFHYDRIALLSSYERAAGCYCFIKILQRVFPRVLFFLTSYISSSVVCQLRKRLFLYERIVTKEGKGVNFCGRNLITGLPSGAKRCFVLRKQPIVPRQMFFFESIWCKYSVLYFENFPSKVKTSNVSKNS